MSQLSDKADIKASSNTQVVEKIEPVKKPIAADEPAADIVEAKPTNPFEQTQDWHITPGQTLESGLRDWCDRMSITLQWDVQERFPITRPIHVIGTFDQAVTSLMRAYAEAKQPVFFEYGLYENDILQVSLGNPTR